MLLCVLHVLVIVQLLSIFDGTTCVPVITDCLVPDTLGGCISCSDCRNLKSKAPPGCQELCDTFSTTTDGSISTLIESTTDTVSRSGYAHEVELGVAVCIGVVIILCVLVYFFVIRPKKQKQPCPTHGGKRLPTRVNFNVATNKVTTNVPTGNDNDAVVGIGDDEKDGVAADQFQSPQSDGGDSGETCMVNDVDNGDVARDIFCSSHTRGNLPIHEPNQICEKDDHKAEFAPTHTNGVKFH